MPKQNIVTRSQCIYIAFFFISLAPLCIKPNPSYTAFVNSHISKFLPIFLQDALFVQSYKVDLENLKVDEFSFVVFSTPRSHRIFLKVINSYSAGI